MLFPSLLASCQAPSGVKIIFVKNPNASFRMTTIDVEYEAIVNNGQQRILALLLNDCSACDSLKKDLPNFATQKQVSVYGLQLNQFTQEEIQKLDQITTYNDETKMFRFSDQTTAPLVYVFVNNRLMVMIGSDVIKILNDIIHSQ